MSKFLSIGELARRAGVAVSALHFYERKGLIISERNAANHRVYRRETLRRLAIIQVAQTLGLSLKEIHAKLARFAASRILTSQDWQAISEDWFDDLNKRIAKLVLLRDRMAGCIGCGCLSVDVCPLYNPDDILATKG